MTFPESLPRRLSGNSFRVLKSIFFIFLFQLVGEVVQKLFQLTVPGPVIGLVLLIVFLLLCDRIQGRLLKSEFEEQLIKTSESILSYLPLLFVPIGVGVVLHISLLEKELFEVMVLLFVGTLSTIGFTAWLMQKIQKKTQRRKQSRGQ